MKAAALVFTITLLTVSVARAEEQDSFRVISLDVACSPPAGTDESTLNYTQGICLSFFRGMTEGMFIMQYMADDEMPTCIPHDASVDRNKAIDVFRAHYKAHPEDMFKTAGVVAPLALLRAFPCNGR